MLNKNAGWLQGLKQYEDKKAFHPILVNAKNQRTQAYYYTKEKVLNNAGNVLSKHMKKITARGKHLLRLY